MLARNRNFWIFMFWSLMIIGSGCVIAGFVDDDVSNLIIGLSDIIVALFICMPEAYPNQ